MNIRFALPLPSTKSTASSNSIRTSTKSSKTSTKSTRTSTRSTRTSSKSTRTSEKPSSWPKQQILNSTTTTLSSTNSSKGFYANYSNVISQEYNSFCHPNCTGTLVGIVFGSLCGVALLVLAFIAASRIYKQRREADNSGAASSNTNSNLSPSTTSSIHQIGNSYESNQTDVNSLAIANNRKAATKYPTQVVPRIPPLASYSNSTELSRISDPPYSVMTLIAKQNPNPTQANSPRIYLELISGEFDAGPPSLKERPAEEEHAYYNVGQNGSSFLGVDNIDYEICDCRVQPTSSVAPSFRQALQKGPCTSAGAPAMASTPSAWNRTVTAKHDNVEVGFHKR